MDAPEISVVIPAYNQARMLLRLLEALGAQRGVASMEVIVVDDCSTDGTAATAESWIKNDLPFPARYHCLERNSGAGAARNAGVRLAKGRVVAFTDTDCVPVPDWLAHLTEALDPDEGWVGTGGPVIPLNRDTLVARYNATYCVLEPIRSTKFPIPFLHGCNCCYLRETLLGAGGFPEDIPVHGGEDVTASLRIFKMGGRFKYAPDAIIQHDFRDNLRGFARTWRNYGFGCGLLAHRMLTPQERNPEWLDIAVENYWTVVPIRPAVTGFRSTLKDLRTQHEYNREIGVPLYQSPPWLFMRAVQGWAYYYGWRQGVAHYERERAKS